MTGFTKLDVAGITFFASGLFCGYLLTALAPMTTSSWAWFASARVVWQLGGTVWCSLIVSREIGFSRWRSLATGTGLGLLLCYNPFLDLIRRPLEIEGQIIDGSVTSGTFARPYGSNRSIVARVQVADGKGLALDIEPAGLQANRWQEMYGRCIDPGGRVRLVALRHLEVVLSLACD
jgi:hypothetical protein